MLEEAGNLIGLSVYAPTGIFVGEVTNLVIDLKNNKVDGLFIESSNEAIADFGVSLNVPFRWVQSVGDVIILKAFPDRVHFTPKEAERSLPAKRSAKTVKQGRITEH
ncbi:MAG: PRC-barrel domain-containing protein [Methanomassiliicoccaceae archaeon]|nr:PRC-barrel domain-containing protein [Methanomassiliicoccaceae archaeon]